MRVLVLFLFTTIVIGQSFSQELTESDLARLQEKFILQTDQNYYLVGDEIGIHFQVEIENQPSFISSTAYFELIDRSGEVRKKVMAPIIEGSGSIRFYLPSTLKSGDFTLIGYTRWMRNYSSKNIPQLGLKILNTFENLDADTFVSDSTLSNENPKPGNYLKFIPNEISTRDTLMIEFLDDLAGRNNQLGLLVRKVISNEFKSYHQVDEDLTIPSEIKYLPDYNGHLVSGKVNNVSEDSQASNLGMTNKEESQVSYSSVSNDGKFYFSSTESLGKDLEFSNLNKNAKIKLEDPFMVDHNMVKSFQINLSEASRSYIEQRNIELQLINAYYSQLRDSLKIAFNELTPKVFLLDDYTRFPTIEDPIVEYIPELRVKGRDEDLYFDMPFVLTSLGIDSILTCINQKPVKPSSLKLNNANYFKAIEVYTTPLAINGLDFKGVLNFVTFPNYTDRIQYDTHISLISYFDLQQNHDFTLAPQIIDNSPDFRNTLYWDFDLKESNEPIQVITSDSKGEYEVILYEFSANSEVKLLDIRNFTVK